MIYEDRKFQLDCEDALLADVLSLKDVHPLAAVPTGAGKTKILSSFIQKVLEEMPSWNVLVLSHTEDILKQDYKAIQEFFPGITIGLNSAGLNSRSLEKITVAGIQSSYRYPDQFKQFNIAIVDEAHTVPTNGNGMYRQFFNKLPHITRVGLTATHFRSGHGFLHEGEGRMFNKLSYDLSSRDNFNKLVDDGYLTTLYSKTTALQMNTDGLRTSAGDFNQKDLADRFDRTSITKRAIREVVEIGQKYKSWLVFAIDIAHADSIAKELQKSGVSAKSLHSRSASNRSQLTDDFKQNKIRAVVSVGMLTTGFDAPNVDLIVLLRPTKSPVLHVQMVGRGLRVAPNKDHCLVLDFAGNTCRLGPINNVQVPQKRNSKGTGEPIVKTCPDCGCIHHPVVKICNACGFEFQFEEKIMTKHSEVDIVEKSLKKKQLWVSVTNVLYSIHEKAGSPNSLRVTYKCGLTTVNEYICFNHSGYAKKIANNWVQFRWIGPNFPLDVHQLFRESKFLKIPKQLYIDVSSKYSTIKDIKF